MNIELENIKVGDGLPPLIVAEISGNHNQDIKKALNLIKLAKKAGANAVKFQTYTADTMTLNIKKNNFKISNNQSLWNGSYLYDLYQKASTPYKWHNKLFDYSRKLGLVPFSSPFDKDAVDFLENLNCCIYKIASFEITDLPLIKHVASKKKPIIISTGMATKSEIRDAVKTAKSEGCHKIILLKCTSTYPANASQANLNTIIDMKREFKCLVGLSDHTLGIQVALGAVALGASVIEKHLTLDRNDGAVDSKFSLEPKEFSMLSKETKKMFYALGKTKYGPSDHNEKLSKNYRRSIHACSDIKKGEIFTYKNLKIIRPENGLKPKEIKKLLGKKAIKNIKYGTPIRWNHIE